MSIVRKTSKNSNFLPPFPQPEIEKIYSSMVCTDTKLHAEIIKLLFWNFHWGHYVSVSHLDSVKFKSFRLILKRTILDLLDFEVLFFFLHFRGSNNDQNFQKIMTFIFFIHRQTFCSHFECFYPGEWLILTISLLHRIN